MALIREHDNELDSYFEISFLGLLILSSAIQLARVVPKTNAADASHKMAKFSDLADELFFVRK
jgi:hypothetical protein